MAKHNKFTHKYQTNSQDLLTVYAVFSLTIESIKIAV